jgi:DNA-binding XRE family transcriptional regulator
MQNCAASDLSSQPAPEIGQKLRQFRKSKGMSLAALALEVSVSEATLSRIETGRTDATAALLYRLATMLNTDITAFFAADPKPIHSGIRSVMRSGEGVQFDTSRMHAHVLCSDLSSKSMHPFLNSVTARTLAEVGGLSSHEGEEFLFIVKGTLLLFSQAYAPLRLEKNESVYFDAAQPHAYVNGGQHKAEFLVITSAGMPEMEKEAPQ